MNPGILKTSTVVSGPYRISIRQHQLVLSNCVLQGRRRNWKSWGWKNAAGEHATDTDSSVQYLARYYTLVLLLLVGFAVIALAKCALLCQFGT